MAAGSIVVDLLMRTGSFETDTARAGKSLKKLQKDAEAIGKGIGLAFTGAVTGLAYMVKSSIDAADHLNDLSKSTGVAVETLGGIGFAASQSGSNLDAVASAIGKLNLSLAKAASGNKEASASLKALGVEALDPLTGKTISADQALVQMANTFEESSDSPEKFAAAAKAVGKSYQELVPLLADGGKALLENIAYYQRFAGVSAETAKKADEFNDTLGKIKLIAGSFARTLTAELLTPLSGIAEGFLKSKEKGDGFKSTAIAIREALIGIATTASFVVNSIDAIGARLSGLVQKIQVLNENRPTKGLVPLIDLASLAIKSGDISKQFSFIDSDVKTETDKAQKTYDDFVKRLREGGTTPDAKKGGRIPGMPDPAAIGEAEAALKKLLDGQLKQIHAFAEQQKDALAFANKFLEGEYQDGLVSLENFFGDQKNIRDRALKIQLDEQDKIIAAEAAFAKRTTSQASRIDAENKIDDARETKTRITVKAAQEEQLALQQNARDVFALQRAFEGVNAQLLDLRENFAAAAAVKFDLQNSGLTQTLKANLNSTNAEIRDGAAAALEAQAALRAAAITQGVFQKASLDSGRTLDELARQEERIALSVQTGALTSLEALSREGEARRKMIPIYEGQVAALQAIANASPKDKNLQAQADNARLALDRLKASADPLAASLNKVFGDDFNSALDDFVTGTKSAADAFKSFAKSVLNDILKLGSKSITESIFGGSGGAGGFLSSLFSSGSVQGGGSAAGGLLSSFASLFSGFFADGGTIPPGKFGVVGERGPEIVVGGQSGQTVRAVQGGTTQNINVQVQGAPNQSRDSAMQQGAAIGLGIQKALARNT